MMSIGVIRLAPAGVDRVIEVALSVPLGELARARSRLGDPGRALALVAAIGALPEQFELGLSGDPRRISASQASVGDLTTLLDRAVREQRCVWLGWSVPRAIAVGTALVL